MPDLSVAGLVVDAAAVRTAVLLAAADDSDVDAGRALWRALGEAHLTEALYQGGGADTSRLLPGPTTTLIRVLDAMCQLGPVLSVCPQIAAVLPILAAAADNEVVRDVWRSNVAGDTVTALAATDGGSAGSDLTGLGTRVRLSTDEVTVDGDKRWVTAGSFADHVLVLARHADGDHVTNFTWVLVPTGAPGVTVQPAGTSLFPGAGIAHLRFDRVRLPRTHVVGRVGYGLASFTRHIATERVVGAVWANAMTRRVIADTHRRLGDRMLRGLPLWRNDVVRHRLTRCAVEQRKLDALCELYVPDLYGQRAQTTAMLLKAAAADTVELVLTTCSQLLGADAFEPGDLQPLRAQAAMFGVAGGARDTVLSGLADRLAQLVGEPGP